MSVVKAAPRDARANHWRPDVDGATGITRRRYRGRLRRGHPTAASDDAVDVRLAIAELQAAHEMLVRCDDASDIEREQLKRTAFAKIALAGRAVDEVTLRRGVR